jgi:hypothetical protein
MEMVNKTWHPWGQEKWMMASQSIVYCIQSKKSTIDGQGAKTTTPIKSQIHYQASRP